MIRRKSQREAAVVRDANVRDVDGDTLVLLFRFPFHAEAIAGSPGNLQEALYEILGIRFQIRCEVAGQALGPAMRPQAVPNAGSSQASADAAPRAGASSTTPAPQSDEDWPATATLGGSGADGGVPPASAQAVTPAGRGRAVAPSKSSSTGRTAARAAAAGRPRPGRPAARDDAWSESGSDEPPYDPEFDPPVPDPTQHVGFDPGDEPVDDGSASPERPSSEQQALDLLRDALGAEKIG
jgi:DNA polymerase-3 subunit gamma/tau